MAPHLFPRRPGSSALRSDLRRHFAIGFFVAGALFLSACTSRDYNRENADTRPSADSQDSPPRVEFAREARRVLDATKVTRYSHDNNIDEKKGRYEVDCSGFVGHVLERAAPEAFNTLQVKIKNARSGKMRRLLALHFVEFLSGLEDDSHTSIRWEVIPKVEDIKAGDIVSWLMPEDMESVNTGHVMIASGAARQNPKRDDEFLVPIFDSTSEPHGKTDKRANDAPNGVGEGVIGLIANRKGAPIAYRWVGGASADRETTIKIGRILTR